MRGVGSAHCEGCRERSLRGVSGALIARGVGLQGVECYGEKLRLKVPDHHQSRRGRQAKENKYAPRCI